LDPTFSKDLDTIMIKDIDAVLSEDMNNKSEAYKFLFGTVGSQRIRWLPAHKSVEVRKASDISLDNEYSFVSCKHVFDETTKPSDLEHSKDAVKLNCKDYNSTNELSLENELLYKSFDKIYKNSFSDVNIED